MKAYWRDLQPYVYTTLTTFVVGMLLGTFAFGYHPELQRNFISGFYANDTLHSLNVWQTFITIFVTNTIKILGTLVLGPIFGIWPLVFVLINGFAIGAVGYIMQNIFGVFLAGVLPHGVFELPALLLGSSLGLALGVRLWTRGFGEGLPGIRQELEKAFFFFFKVVMPLLFFAAAIEVFITPKILQIAVILH